MIRYAKSKDLCILRLSNSPLNVIGLQLLESLLAAVNRANADDDIHAIMITGSQTHFSAGADINILTRINSPRQAIRTARTFQQAFDRIENSDKPVVAALAGHAMGAGLELAIACHFRLCTHDALFSCPEVNLAINPAAGATQRLPRLIGPAPALKMLLTAQPINASRALQLGLVDALCKPGQLIQSTRTLLRSAQPPIPTSRRTKKIANPTANLAAFKEAATIIAAARPQLLAPRKILEAVRTGIEQSYQAGLKKERHAFAQCLDTPAARNKIYLFFASRKTAQTPRLPRPRPSKITTAAVVGAGSMGTGIAQAFASAGLSVILTSTREQTLNSALRRIQKSLRKQLETGRITTQHADELLARITTTTSLTNISPADLVIEAVPEKPDIKQAVLSNIAAICRHDALIASNTSTIDLDVLARNLPNPARFLGLHFFNPAHAMPLVEVAPANKTEPPVIAAAIRLVSDLRKTPILVKNSPAFLVNRIFIPYLKEAFQLLEDGAAPTHIDAAALNFGFPMGPLSLADMIGLDVLLATDTQICKAFPRHKPISPVAASLVQHGCLGQKTAAGVYKYPHQHYTPSRSSLTHRIIARVQRAAGKTPRCIDTNEVTDRLVMRMLAEASYVLREEIASRQSDIDVAMVLGTGFPDFRGGPLRYARDLGIEKVTARLDELAEKFGPRFRPCHNALQNIGV